LGTGRRSRPGRARWRLLRRSLRRILTERSTPGRLGWAVAVGVFIAVTPLYGLHTLMGIGAASAFGLNRPLTLLATTFPLPFLQPALALGGLQIGAVTLTGEFLPVSLDTLHEHSFWSFSVLWTVGTVILGTLLGAPLGLLTVVMAKRYRRDRTRADPLG